MIQAGILSALFQVLFRNLIGTVSRFAQVLKINFCY